MGYERNDGRYGRDQGYGRDQSYGRDQARSSYGAGDSGRRDFGRDDRGRDYGRQPQGYDYDDRGFFDRAGDEVRSWFGDEEAERRRRQDERHDERDYQRNYGGDRARGDAGRNEDRYGSDWNRGYRSTSDREQGLRGGFGSAYGSGGASAGDYGAGNFRQREGHDPSYRSWRDRQMESFDRDYEDYRREHQSKFENEFHSWRQGRQSQRDSLTRVQEHQEVVGSDGQHVGKVDHVRGDRILLAKNDQDAGGHHHSIPSSWIQSVDDKVTISKTADEAKKHWRDEERNSAIGSGNDRNDQNPRNLNRSFSGTY